jgi:hypothetical protein
VTRKAKSSAVPADGTAPDETPDGDQATGNVTRIVPTVSLSGLTDGGEIIRGVPCVVSDAIASHMIAAGHAVRAADQPDDDEDDDDDVSTGTPQDPSASGTGEPVAPAPVEPAV